MHTRWVVAVCFLVLAWSTPAASQMTFTNRASFCQAMSEASSPTLMARTRNVTRSQSEALMQGMTDPRSIRMVKELLDFAYARPVHSSVDKLQAELRAECLAGRIFKD
jgi:hypothetical protein